MVRVGLIGYGLAGASFHAPLIVATPGMELAAIATSRSTDPHPTARRHPDAQALLADGTLDLIVVATPNDSHAIIARAALAGGRHVVVDKPLATSVEEGAALARAAEDAGRCLSVFHNRRWDADFRTVRTLLRDGVLGEVMLAEMHWDRLRPAIKPGWREQGGPGSGLLADLGPHLVDQALTLFGMPTAVSADIGIQREGAVVDDHFAMTLHYRERRVRIASSSLVAAPRPRFALYGTRASFVKHGIDPQEAVLRAGGRTDVAGYGIEDKAALGVLTQGDGTATRVASRPGDWRRFYARMREAVLGQGPVPVDPWDAVDGLRILAAARESAAQGRVVMVATARDGTGSEHISNRVTGT